MDAKLIVIVVLFLLLVAVKLWAGNRPFDQAVRRRRRFGPRSAREHLKDAPQPPPEDPEKEFFDKEGPGA